jgi:hypothetical protein
MESASIREHDKLDQLHEVVRSELRNHLGEPTVIHAGHYILHAEGDVGCDHLEEVPVSIPALGDFVALTKRSWEIACGAIASIHSPTTVKLIVLVNDWQFLRVAASTKREAQRRASKMRFSYYNTVSRLPEYHERGLTSFGISSSSIMPFDNDRVLFSETELRGQLARTLTSVMKDPAQPTAQKLTQYFTPAGQSIIHAKSYEGEYPLVYCGNTNCAGEFMQLLKLLHDRGTVRFVNLYPLQCRGPVTKGTELAEQVYGLEGMKITNIAIPPDSAKTEAIIDRFNL